VIRPGGRPKVVVEVKELAREHAAEAIQTLVSIMNDPKSAPAARVSASNSLLDRGYGKPPQHITSESGTSYVALLPEVAKSTAEWEASVQRMIAPPSGLPAPQEAFPKPDGRIAVQKSSPWVSWR
jgi:hypothetical protein